MTSKTMRQIAVLASATLLLGAFVAGPADAGKRKKKKPPVPICATYVPSGTAEGAEVNVVTDAHTAEAPLSITLTTEPGAGAGRDPEGEGMFVSHVYVPIQVDTASAAGGALYSHLTWGTVIEDFDQYLDAPDGTVVANSAGYGTVDDGSTEDSEHDFGSEKIISVDSVDCTNYTLDVVTAMAHGGEVTLDLYLGE